MHQNHLTRVRDRHHDHLEQTLRAQDRVLDPHARNTTYTILIYRWMKTITITYMLVKCLETLNGEFTAFLHKDEVWLDAALRIIKQADNFVFSQFVCVPTIQIQLE